MVIVIIILVIVFALLYRLLLRSSSKTAYVISTVILVILVISFPSHGRATDFMFASLGIILLPILNVLLVLFDVLFKPKKNVELPEIDTVSKIINTEVIKTQYNNEKRPSDGEIKAVSALTLQDKIIAYRELKGLSQTDLSTLSQLPIKTIQEIEKGLSKGTPHALLSLANAFEIPFENLILDPINPDKNKF